jgi:two-component system chemotaxis sensor kinase CheA
MTDEKKPGQAHELTRLVEQAACSLNLLDPANPSEMLPLQDVLRQIHDVAGRMEPQSSDLHRQLEGAADDAVQGLQQIVQRQVEDTSKALQAVSKAICVLQDLIRRWVESETIPAACKPATQDNPPANSASAAISEEDAALIVDFITEAGEHIETAESALLELEDRPGDGELVNKIFRAFHTIKGMAGFLNLTHISSLAHSAESLLDLARKGRLTLAGASSDVAFESLDTLKKMLAELKNALESGTPVGPPDHLPDLLEKLKAAAEGRIASSTQTQPKMEEQDDKKLDSVLDDASRSGKKPAGTPGAQLSEDKIRVSTTRLDNLINMTGELVIAQLMVSEQVCKDRGGEHDLARKVAHEGKIVRELQELSMSMRMVPIQSVFQKMARLVRDLSHKAGKPVDLITAGEETELDRTVVDRIADPLVHMIRNAVDHGIESPEERAKAGKNPTGRVGLRAFHQAGSIVIEVEDDGKGLSRERILAKAVEQGLVAPDQELSDDEVYKLIFHAGLSTAERVTSVSGRGVGMDVVRKNIESLRGRIDISTTLGKATVFTIRLPLTLAIIDGQVVRIGGNRYIVPITSIIRSLRPAPGQISTVQHRGEVVLERGELLPLVRLYKLFGVTPSTEDPAEALIMIVEEDGKRCCLLVDDLLAQQQVVIKCLGEGLGRIPGVSGGAIMGDGQVTLILDIPGLMELAQRT